MQREINHSLERLIIETNAEHAVFATKSGEILEHRGTKLGAQIVSIAALLTGVFNTTKELAKLIDESNFNQFFIKGREWKLFYYDVSSLFILIVLFKDRTILGTVKMSSEKFANKIKRIFEQEEKSMIETSILREEGATEEELLKELFKE